MGTDNKGRVLVVDEDPEICRLLVKRLTREEFYCESCSSGKEALELQDRGKFDAIISDLRMAGISGVDLLQATRKNHPNSAFLMATVEDDIRVGIEAMKQGAADYLVKPLDLDVVVANLERALEKKRLEQQLENYRERLEQFVQQRTRQLRAATKRIEQTYDDTLEALAGALDLRDNETAGHSRRVSRYCLEIARAMNCSPEELRQIARGSYLHDIGKIGIPDSILRKPAKLTDKEMAVMQTHARIGYDLVSRIAFLAPAAEIVLTHQERFAGTGYPQGLAGLKSRSVRGFLPWPTRWTPSPPTGRTAVPWVSPTRGRKSSESPGASSIRKSSGLTFRSPKIPGKTSGSKSPGCASSGRVLHLSSRRLLPWKRGRKPLRSRCRRKPPARARINGRAAEV